jgi:PAS domain S-box-containing protein
VDQSNVTKLARTSLPPPLSGPNPVWSAIALNDLPIGILVFDLHAKVVAENQHCQGLFNGVSLLGKGFVDIECTLEYQGETPLAGGQCPIRQVIEDRRPLANITMALAGVTFGETRWLLISASPRLGANGELLSVVCSLQDISQFKCTKLVKPDRSLHEVLQNSNREWTATVDAIPDMIVLEDAEGALLRCNRATAAFFNLPYAEIISKKLTSLFVCEETKSYFGNPFRDGAADVQFAGRDGWFEIINHLAPTEAGSACRWVHVIKDVTAQKRSEAMLRQLNTVIEQTAESIIITDSIGIIQYANARFEEMTGWNSSDVNGLHFLTVDGQSSKLTMYAEVMDALSKGQIWRGVHTARRKNGSSYEEETTISPVKDLNGNLLNCIAVSRDVTERKQLEAIAEAANMVENVGYIFSGIRHELGNPINSIKTALSVLSNNIEQWPRGHILEYLNRALKEVRRVEYLLKALKTFNMHENPKMQSVDLFHFIENLLKLAEKDFSERGIRISTSLDSNFIKCNADPRALHQVFLNLLANAADALQDKNDPTIFISINRLGKMIHIKIIDNGVGMDESQQKNFFKPFFTSKASGTGLGLVIVKKMLASMNGTITIKSELDVGTEVSLLLEAMND